MPKKKQEELALYDYFHGKSTLRYSGRKESEAERKKDPGVLRTLHTPGSATDPLCQLWWGDMLTGEALADAPNICGPKPEGFELGGRFIKTPGESGGDY